MSEPEGYANRYYLEHPTLDNTRNDLIELFRLAMMAAKAEEREACGQLVNDRAEEIRAAKTVTANTMARIFDDLASEIRNKEGK